MRVHLPAYPLASVYTFPPTKPRSSENISSLRHALLVIEASFSSFPWHGFVDASRQVIWIEEEEEVMISDYPGRGFSCDQMICCILDEGNLEGLPNCENSF